MRIVDQIIIEINSKQNKKQMGGICADQVGDHVAEDLVLKTIDWLGATDVSLHLQILHTEQLSRHRVYLNFSIDKKQNGKDKT